MLLPSSSITIYELSELCTSYFILHTCLYVEYRMACAIQAGGVSNLGSGVHSVRKSGVHVSPLSLLGRRRRSHGMAAQDVASVHVTA